MGDTVGHHFEVFPLMPRLDEFGSSGLGQARAAPEHFKVLMRPHHGIWHYLPFERELALDFEGVTVWKLSFPFRMVGRRRLWA